MAQNNFVKAEAEKLAVTADKPPSSTRLEKQQFDCASHRIQMILGCFVAGCLCIVAYQPIMHVGFLLDDFLHVDYVARAFGGDAHDFLANFSGNWAGSDLMKSYRPLVSLSFATDYLIWHANPFGYHLTNILLLCGICLFIALITLELTGRSGNRMLAAPAVWSALLFAVYPLHPEATAWIVGRVDLLCTLFYLASVFFFLRYQQILESRYILFSLIAFVLSLISKEMAVTLPLTLTAAAILLRAEDPPRQAGATVLPSTRSIANPGGISKKRIASTVVANAGIANAGIGSVGRIGSVLNFVSAVRFVWPFWATLIGIALIRSHFLGTLVGGYGQVDVHSAINSMSAFLDRASLNKVVAPISEELRLGKQLAIFCSASIASIVALGVFRTILCKSTWNSFIFLIFWCVIALIPTFQIWHIYPNLVGSRLFFLSSAPMCILLALLAEPATEKMDKPIATIFASLGAVTLSATFLLWTYCLEKNLGPWIEAGKRMASVKQQLEELSLSAHGRPVSLMSLPRDYKGAGMLTRASYLTILCKPPFQATDISKSFASTDSLDAQGSQIGERLSELAANPLTYCWSEELGRFIPWKKPTGATFFLQNFTASSGSKFKVVPSKVMRSTSADWLVRKPNEPYFEQHEDFLRVYPGTSLGPLRLIPHFFVQLDPLEAQYVRLEACIHEKDDQLLTEEPNPLGKISVCWHSTGALNGQEFERPLDYVFNGLYIATVGETRDWCLSGAVTDLGIKFMPGNYVVDVYSMKAGAVASSKLIPKLNSKTLNSREAGAK